jgi:PKD repeat protein
MAKKRGKEVDEWSMIPMWPIPLKLKKTIDLNKPFHYINLSNTMYTSTIPVTVRALSSVPVKPLSWWFKKGGNCCLLPFILMILCTGFRQALAQTPPTGFTNTILDMSWDRPVGVSFSTNGQQMYVWEKAGKIFLLEWNATTKTYVRQATPLLDISEEVGNWRDFGMLGFVLDPRFETNGYLYVMYVVDRHHLINFGKAGYSATANDYFKATIGRITRYTARASDNFRSVDLSSRKVLLGETISTGIPILHESHGIGSLAFGTDGTLLASCGDGASYASTDLGNASETYYTQALADGIIKPKENVGAFRSQMVDSYNGKILRLDPETGNGVPSNPYYDSTSPRTAKSRVWALGLRNPCRITKKPGTGSHLASDGNPGVLYVGDVGWNSWEDLHVINAPGLNCGWPLFEGMEAVSSYTNPNVANQDAPNPLYGTSGCTQQYFYFRDLLKQETPTGTASFPNPCNTANSIPGNIPTFVHSRPALDWQHGTANARTGTFSGNTATVATVGVAGSPVGGTSFGGNCSMGGVWYMGDNFPPQYKNTYFHADYGAGWIKNFVLDGSDKPKQANSFIDNNAIVVSMAECPLDGTIYYADIASSKIRRISYGGNRPPVAVASASQYYGTSPLTVQFTGDKSSDPEGQSITYQWDFGDGTPISTSPNPLHQFISSPGVPTKYTVTLEVKDDLNVVSTTTLTISTNNTPPQVHITSPVNNTRYSLAGETIYALTAQVTDQEQGPGGLSYQWQTILQHNNHQHVEEIDTNPLTTTRISPVGCDGEEYYFIIALKVTDAAGLSASDTVRLYPDCDNLLNVSNLNAVAGNGQASLTWNNPTQSFAEVMVVAKASAGITALPSGDGSAYVASTNFTDNGSSFDGGKVVYKGTEPSVLVTGLTNNTTYYFRVFTRIGSTWSNGVETIPTPTCQPPQVQASSLSFSSITDNALTVQWVNGSGNGRIVKMNVANSFSAPVNGSSLAANANYTGTGEQVVFNGSATQVQVTGLNPSTTYYFEVYEYNCSGSNTTFLTTGTTNAASQATQALIKTTPTLTWNKPADITLGMVLGSAQLNAQATINGSPVAGSYVYSPAAGTALAFGNNQPLTVTFTPSDLTRYNSVSASVKLNVFYAPGACAGNGVMLREVWNNVSGSDLSSIPLDIAPSSTSQLNSFEGPTDVADNYGTRYRGYICAPETGNYNFWIASDDFSELWLSTDENPANKVLIAWVYGWTSSREWTKMGTQQSGVISLQAGRRYYVEALQKEGIGGDNLAVGWRLPSSASNAAPVVIPGSALSSFVTVSNTPPTVSLTAPANNATFAAPANLTLTATAADSDGTIAKVEFFNSTTLLATVTTSPYTFSWTNVAAGSYTLTAKATDNQGAATTSAAVNVTVDKTTPVVNWSNPADILQGTALSSVQLNATANVAGSFTYTPAAGTVLGVGNGQSLSVLFTPNDVASYNTATASVLINVQPSTPAQNCSSSGTLLREFWANVAGTGVSAIPVNTAPTSTSQVSSFAGPVDVANLYGARYRGYLCVPTSGNYTFWIAGDNDCELWLSNSDSPTGKQRIAFIQDGFAFVNQWSKYASQQSSPIALVAGQRYYVEALHKEAYGGDNLAVGWQLPNGTLERPIPGTRLSPFVTVSNTPPTVSLTAPTNHATFAAPANLTLTATAADSDGSVAKVEFFNGTTLLATVTASPYTYSWTNVADGSYTLTAKATDNQGATTTSETVSITVNTILPPNACTASGTLLREFWTNVPGTGVAAIPVNTPPTSTSQVSSFEAPANVANLYGARYRGYLCVPTSGNYTFWIVGDNDCELWLSSSDSPAGKQRIAFIQDGFAFPNQWTKYASQQSSPIALIAGQRYYVEALHKEAYGGDNLAVGWQLPNGTLERPIPGTRLSPFILPTARVDSEAEIAASKALELTASPNPFSEQIKLSFTSPQAGQAALELFDLRGVLLKPIYRGEVAAGEQVNVEEEGKELAAGIYLLRLQVGSMMVNQRIILIR